MDGHLLGSFPGFPVHLTSLLNITLSSLYFYSGLKPPHWSPNTADGVEIWTQASWTASISLMVQTKCPDLAGLKKPKQEHWSPKVSAHTALRRWTGCFASIVLLPQPKCVSKLPKGNYSQSSLSLTLTLYCWNSISFSTQRPGPQRCHQPSPILCLGCMWNFLAAEMDQDLHMQSQDRAVIVDKETLEEVDLASKGCFDIFLHLEGNARV